MLGTAGNDRIANKCAVASGAGRKAEGGVTRHRLADRQLAIDRCLHRAQRRGKKSGYGLGEISSSSIYSRQPGVGGLSDCGPGQGQEDAGDADSEERASQEARELAQAMRVSPGRVSQIERGELATIDAVARYIDALGGRLDLIASFGDHTLTVTTTEAA